jgi:hypothetical protein
MPAPYYLKATNSDLTGGADFTKRLDADVAAQGTLSVTIAKAASEDSLAFTPAGTPGVNGGTGSQSWTVKVNVTTAAASTNIAVAVARVNSAGTQQSISSFTAFQSSGSTGVKTFTLSSVNLGTWVAGDRLKVVYRFQNTHSSQTRTVVIATGTTDTQVTAPWAAPASLTPAGLGVDIAPGSVAPSLTAPTRTRGMGVTTSITPPNVSRVRVSWVELQIPEALSNMNPTGLTHTRGQGSLTAQWSRSVSITGLSRA